MPNSYSKPVNLTITNTHLTDIKGDGFSSGYHALSKIRLEQEPIREGVEAVNVTTDKLDPRIPASGTLDVVTDYKRVLISASDVLQHSNDAVNEHTETAYTKVKEIITAIKGTYRVKFDMSTSLQNDGFGRVYKNGVAHGTEQQTTQESTYETWSEDLEFDVGDLIQLYSKNAGIYDVRTRNFRLYGDIVNNFHNSVV